MTQPGRVRRAVVVGAGPAGLTAAIALRGAGIDPLVVEHAANGERGSGLTLWPNALKALELIGAADAVRAAGVACDGITMLDWRGNVLDRTDRGLMETRFGGAGTALQRAELIASLHALAGDLEWFGASCVGVESGPGGAAARLSDGSVVEGDVLIGADGIHSTVRETAVSRGVLRYAGYAVWRAVTAYDLGGERAGTLSLGRGAQVGVFPMARGRAYWFATEAAPEGAAAWSEGAHARLLDRFAGWHRPLLSVIAETDPADLVVSDVHDLRPLPQWSCGRVTLLGDAAHASTPALGQGACQAIEDAVVLAHCLRVNADPGAAFEDYERRRFARANATVREAWLLGRMGQWANPLACRLRDALIRRTPERVRLRGLERMFSFEL
jgi:2-polyprenyl-6-methoxyphenol hydroxylase-like FAD-dependent oxidoreductase